MRNPRPRWSSASTNHLRGVHAGVIRCTGRAPEGLRFAMPLESYGAGDRRETLSPTWRTP